MQYFRLQQFSQPELLNSLKDFNNPLTCFIGMSKDILLFTCDLFPMAPTVPGVNIRTVGCRETSQPRALPAPAVHPFPPVPPLLPPPLGLVVSASPALYPYPGRSEPQESWSALGRRVLLGPPHLWTTSPVAASRSQGYLLCS